MFYPKVSGIIATDIHGHIVGPDGRPILHGTEFEDLDRSIFNEYLSGHVKESGRSVIVTGRNNFNAMGSAITSKFQNNVVLSDSDRVEIMGGKTYSPDQLLAASFQRAFQMRANIFVLGGRSVYEAFQRHYSHFVHVELIRKVEGASKKVNVYHGSLNSGPSVPTLITRDMNIPMYRIIDNGEIRVTEHNAWENFNG